jgi:hypothetical protein
MARWYGFVPKDERKNRQWRLDVIRQAAGSRETREYVWEACRADTLFYFNGFYWTFDPRLPGDKTVPFITYPFQDRAIERIENSIHHGMDLVIEKSRDLGASWVCMGVFEKRWHFIPDQEFLVISRDEDSVDKPGKKGSLFGKVDFLHNLTPPWLMPKGWPGEPKKPCRTRGMFVNPDTGATITCSATIAAGGVGDRVTAILFDEFSRHEKGDELDLGTADTTNCRIFNFTAYGEGNAADRLRRAPGKRKMKLVWWMDPRKNRGLYQWDGDRQKFRYFVCNAESELEECPPHEYGDWADDPGLPEEGLAPMAFEPHRDGKLRSPEYDHQERRRGNPRWMAINWDIDYVASDNKFFDMKLIRELETEDARDPVWVGDVEVDEGTGEFIGLVQKENGPLKLWCRLDALGNPPKSDLGYAAGVDISTGRGITNSCLMFGDADTGEKVAEYVTPHHPPEKFARRSFALGYFFLSASGTPALMAWEKCGPGEDFGKSLDELGYSHLYYHSAELDRVKQNRPRFAGWPPSAARRAILFGEYQVSLRQRRFRNRSSIALRECSDFIETPIGCEYKQRFAMKKGKGVAAMDTTGAKANHGDRVTGDALCNAGMIQLGRPKFDRPDEEKQNPAEVFGTLAWRIKRHQREVRNRRDGHIWG